MVTDRMDAQFTLSAVTLATHDMARAIRFYESLGLELRHGGSHAALTSLAAGDILINLITAEPGARWGWWGRIIFHVKDVDALYQRALGLGYLPQDEPRDAPWGERYFHLADPDGHELSFACPLPCPPVNRSN